jgi:8-oxo-dGTP pyrophosphatase MutT (NUDIX family)
MMADLKPATLMFLIDGEKILLAMKKRGFGVGLWNGVGGKPEANESIEQTAIRECSEEINVVPKKLNKVAVLDFFFPDKKSDWNQQVHVFLCDEWSGEPIETEEMKPQWYQIKDIPFDLMWEDDNFWLPGVLSGEYITASFYFDEAEKLTKQSINYK